MAYYIPPEGCVACGWCENECDTHAIAEKGMIYVIDSTKCTECIVNDEYDVQKCVLACITKCIVPDPNHRETREQLLEKYNRLHPIPPPVSKS